MNFSLQLLLLLVANTAVYTAAMTCKKDKNSIGVTDGVMEMGQYIVRTTQRTDSDEVKGLISTLDGASDIQYRRKSFTAFLQPRDLKKLCNSTHLVRSIKEMKKIKNTGTNGCYKLKKGNPKFVIPMSYIVMIKSQSGMSEMTPIIMTTSNDLNSSVMISSVKEFHNPNRRGATMKMNTDGVNFMCSQSAVDYIEEDQEVTVASPTSPWHLDRIDQSSLPLDGQFTSPNNGSGVDVYVFDTGIKYDHNEFEGRAKYDFYDPVDTMLNENQRGNDCHGHGTHVAALVAGKTYGVAKGATVYSMRVMYCNGKGSFTNVLLGINHVIDRKMSNKDRRIIISMSLTGPVSQAVNDAIKDATNQGILVVVAAGNDFTDACRYSPAASPYALTVGGTQRNDNLYLRLFDGTNYGKCVDIFAPGQDVVSAGIRSRDAVSTLSGTSQATPIVSGTAAVYWNINRDATALDIKDTIISTCTRDKLKIRNSVPSPYAEQSPNCLLFMDNKKVVKNIPLYNMSYSVSSSEVVGYIKQMEKKFYSLAYINRHSMNSTVHYSLIFKYMADVEFVTVFSVKLKQLKTTVKSYKAKGYQPTLIHDFVNSSDSVAVLVKSNRTYSQKYKQPKETHEKLYQSKSSKGYSLLSTSVTLFTRTGKPRFTTIYVKDNVITHYLPNVSNTELAGVLDAQLNREYYLKHLATIPTKPPSYAVVFHKMTKPSTNYVMFQDLELNEVGEIVQMQVSKGFTPLVIAGLDTPNGLKFVVSFEK